MKNRYQLRSFVLLTVLVIITLAALAASTVMFNADAQSDLGDATTRRVQSRALAWSGVQAMMAELADQRTDLLLGSTPALSESFTLYTDELDNRGVVRLVPMESGMRLESESAKLDLNTATAEMLAKLSSVDESLAQRIVQARQRSLFQSPEELLGVSGVTPYLLYGSAVGTPGDEFTMSDSSFPSGSSDSALPLRTLVTVFSFDPSTQSGVGPDAEVHEDQPRINLNVAWSDELEAQLRDRFSQPIADLVKREIEQGNRFASAKDLTESALARSEDADLAQILDAFTTSTASFVPGLVDVAHAPREVLACLPGIDASVADAIVQSRATADERTQGTSAWLTGASDGSGIVDRATYAELSSSIRGRSLQWRFRIEAGILPAETLSLGPNIGGSIGETADISDAKLRDRVVYDVVVDLSTPEPRVAYLRDLTNWQAVSAWNQSRQKTLSTDPSDMLADEEFSNESLPRVDSMDELDTEDDTSPLSDSLFEDDFGFSDSVDLQPVTVPDDSESSDDPPTAPGKSSASDSGRIGRWRASGGGS